TSEQVAEITGRLRNIGVFQERTHKEQSHPSRRIYSARVDAHRKGTPWPEVQPMPDMVGPPPGWDIVGSARAIPPVFRIAPLRLRVQWTPPQEADPMDAALGRASEASRYVLTGEGRRRPTDDDVETVFQLLGTTAYTETKTKRARKERVFMTTAGW